MNSTARKQAEKTPREQNREAMKAEGPMASRVAIIGGTEEEVMSLVEELFDKPKNKPQTIKNQTAEETSPEPKPVKRQTFREKMLEVARKLVVPEVKEVPEIRPPKPHPAKAS
jgi:uncharacterized iron-regulated membrane protein